MTSLIGVALLLLEVELWGHKKVTIRTEPLQVQGGSEGSHELGLFNPFEPARTSV